MDVKEVDASASVLDLSAHDVAVRLAHDAVSRNLNEADTRHQLIDEVLHGVLSWPRNLTSCESYIDPGFADYCLRRTDGTILLLLEAKREGLYFNVPNNNPSDSTPKYISVRTLLTDPNVKQALYQVRQYCVDIGCQFAGITNGHEWILFRTFQANQDWRNIQAFVVPSLLYFSERFTDAVNKLGYKAISEAGALGILIGVNPLENRPTYYPKTGIVAYDAPINANFYSSRLRPILDRYFDKLDENDAEFMDFCYVTDQRYQSAFQSARHRLRDSLTPYLKQYQIRQIENAADGGAFSNRLEKTIRDRPGADVLVLFGGKGVGKSTFLRRLLYHRPPQIIKKHAVCCIVDLLEAPNIRETIYQTIWSSLVEDLDDPKLLQEDRSEVLKLFADRFDQAKKQDLFGLAEDTETYNVRLNDLTQRWLADKKYCAKRLALYHARQHRGIIVVVDNTDQFNQELQDFCFTVAHDISKELGCASIISMREERFYASSIHGTLDAYHNSGFHISAPSPVDVFHKRTEYVLKLLSRKDTRTQLLGEDITDATVERIQKLFHTFSHEFKASTSHLADFLSACAHGNIRIALDLFKGFVLSRYTNVTEITSVVGFWTILIHQVLKPIMIPYRFFYEEKQSHVPNVFQVRSHRRGSHFTALRILSDLASGDPTNPPSIPLPKIAAKFTEILNMKDDFEVNLDMLLKFGLVEADNRIDEFSTNIDSVRITNYGLYLLRDLSQYFTYLELISVDCAISSEQTSNTLMTLANQEYDLWAAGLDDSARRIKRVEKRLEKAQAFITYLGVEEKREIDTYGITQWTPLVPPIAARFETEKQEVARSAAKQRKGKRYWG